MNISKSFKKLTISFAGNKMIINKKENINKMECSMYKQLYRINYMSHDAIEHWEMEIIRPKGTNDYDIILFKCDALINLKDKYEPIYPNACIIYSPQYPQYYRANNCRLRNDYIHFYISEDNDIFRRINIPFNKVFYPVNADYISTIIEQIYINHQLKDKYSDENIDNLMNHLLLTIARESEHSEMYEKNPYKRHLYNMLYNARREILKNYNRNWTVKEMASLCNLSESRFSVLYNEFFGISPMGDIINTRIENAKFYLVNDVKSVTDIALNQLGYNNVFHFIRQFKQHTGLTPAQYRNFNRRGNREYMKEARSGK